jgi:hypothetical protein
MTEEKKMVEFAVSKEVDFEVDMKDGKLRLVFAYDGKGLDTGLYVDLEPDYFLDKLAALIPGELDDAVLAMVKSALKAL